MIYRSVKMDENEPRRAYWDMLKATAQIVLVVVAVAALVFGSQQLGIR